jgi:hypothetical protein
MYRDTGGALGISVNGTPRIHANAGNVAVVGNSISAANVITSTHRLTVGGERKVDGLPAVQPTWRNLGIYTDPPTPALQLTLSNVSTYQNTVTNWGITSQPTLANRPTYVNTDPLDGKPAIQFDRTALQSLSGTPITINCETNGGLTFIIMFKFTGTVSNYEGPFYSAANGGNFYLERGAVGNSITFALRNDATALTNVKILNTVLQEQWNVFAFRYVQIAGTWTLQGFRNGVKVVESTAANPLINHTMSPYIARNNFNGSMRYLGVWDRPLSDAELAKVTEAARIYPDLQGVAPICRFLQGSRDSCLTESASDMLMPGPTGFPGSSWLAGAVLLPDGRIFCPPYAGTTARLVDPRTNVVTIPAVTFPSGGAFQGGILLPNGKVFLVPHFSTYAMLFDPATETVTTSAAVFPGANAYQGAVLLPDGTVYMTPYAATNALQYDYVTDTLSTPPGTFPANSFISCALTSDGKVLCIPYGSTTARVYDPVARTLSIPIGTFSGNYYGGVLLPDGRVFCCPYSATTARIYDSYTNTVSTPAGTYTSTGWSGGVRLSCGRVALIPYNAASAIVFDSVSETISTPRGTIAAPSSSYWGGILLPDGRVFMTPYSKTQAVYMYTGGNGFASLPPNVLLSPWCNNNM